MDQDWTPITVWNGTTRVGPAGSLLALDGAVTANGEEQAQFTIRSDNRRVDALDADNAWVSIDWPWVDRKGTEHTERLMTGPVTTAGGGRTDGSPTRTYTVSGDWGDTWHNVVYPNPNGTDAQQGDENAYYVSDGPLETVILDLISQSQKKSGQDLVIPTSQGRGSTVSVSMRVHSLYDRLLPYVQGSGLLCRVVRSDTDGLPHVVITEPAAVALPLREDSGVISTSGWAQSAPTANIAVVMAGGEGTARKMQTYTDATALAQSGGIPRQIPVDARDLELDDPNLADLMQQRADQALAENSAKTSLAFELSETGWFRFGQAYVLGSPLTIIPDDGPTLQDSVRQIKFTITGGPKLTPVIGEWADDQTDKAVFRSVETLRRQVHDLQRSL